jgi:hypothetical protein
MKTSMYVLLAVLTFAPVAVAQSKKDRVEIGVQATSLTLFAPDFFGDETQQGIGGRVAYNFNRSIAAEAEINVLPQSQFILSADGPAIQAQFGVKLGKRFKKFGVFAKARPGFITVDDRFTLGPALVTGNDGLPAFDFRVERTNFFTMDVGGVLELYPSRRMVVRFDAGDTAIRHPAQFEAVFNNDGSIAVRQARPPKFANNFQFTAGVAFRLGDFPAEDGDPNPPANAREGTPRYEVGVQFTSMLVDRPSPVCTSVCLSGGEPLESEPGPGARFTFNLSESIALEAEGNFYTRDRFALPNPAGHMFQGQFGPKIGKRYEKWGWFGKARPGFVAFTKVSELVATHSIMFFGRTFEIGDFHVARKFYPSIDLGGVLEFYISRRWMARFDIGDTIIRYGEVQAGGFSLSEAIVRRPPETRHNLQFTSGIGFRF